MTLSHILFWERDRFVIDSIIISFDKYSGILPRELRSGIPQIRLLLFSRFLFPGFRREEILNTPPYRMLS